MTEMEDKFCVVFVTVPDKGIAEHIAGEILKDKLCACVNIIDGITSMYWWKEKIEKSSEALMIIKTTITNYKSLEAKIIDLHPYEVPEVISLDLKDGNNNYLKWIIESVKK